MENDLSVISSVMHVEDDEDILEIAKLALELVGGLTVQQFSSGTDAVANAADCTPDLLLLDQMMPDMNGEQTLAALRKFPHLKEVPDIFMCAKTVDSSERLMTTTDAIGFVVKPFDPMALADQLREIVDGKT